MRILSSKDMPRMRARAEQASSRVEEDVRAIIRDVRENGDSAVCAYTERFDGARIELAPVSKEEIEAAVHKVSPALMDTLMQAHKNITDFHAHQKRTGFCVSGENGAIMGVRVLPLARVGLYVPGGTASYPSTVLMNAVPAKIAGVKEIIMATPPGKDGAVNPAVLAAAYVAGVDAIYKMGGAQAIAALAYGTQSVPRVDKVTGPGNIYVATAKRLVYGQCDIDMVAGPSEILIIADESADAKCVAADLLSQAEHDALSACTLVTTSMALAKAVQNEVETQLNTLPRRDIASKSIAAYGMIVVVESLEEAMAIANDIAPEHLELCVRDPFALMGAVRNAGSVFLGHHTPEALGDYFAGPNHTLPTSGTARFSSALSVDDFVKKSSFLYYSKDALEAAGEHVARFARAEGLEAHARSVEARFEVCLDACTEARSEET